MFNIVELPEMADPSILSSRSKQESHKALVSVEEDAAIEFFDETNSIYHQYNLPDIPRLSADPRGIG